MPKTNASIADGGVADPREASRRRPRHWARAHWVAYLLILPALLAELLVHVVPMLVGLWVSFRELTRSYIRSWSEAPFIGWENYRIALDFTSSQGLALLGSFGVTVGFTVLVVGLSWGLGMAGALALQRSMAGRGVWRALFLIPYALPAYASVITWNFMLQRDTGVINHILVDNLGLLADRPFWLIGPNAFISVVTVAVWERWPFAFLMLMAGLQAVPSDLYEAAALDGAGALHQFRHITLPMLRPVNTVLILVMSLWTFNNFSTPFVLFGTAQPPAGNLISFHIYNSSFLNWDFGLGAAMSVLLLGFLLVASLVYLRVTNRKGRLDA